MGVKGLETFVRLNEFQIFGGSEKLSDLLKGKVLVIDFAGLVYFLLDRVPDSEGCLSYLKGTSTALIEQLKLFTRRLASEGILQAWVNFLSFLEYATNMS